MNQSVAVVHLVWLPFGMELFRNFIQSYKIHDAGYPHDLVIIFNGVTNKADTDSYHHYLKQQGIRYSDFYLASELDLIAYKKIASGLTHNYVLFLNSYAVLLSAQWLRFFVDAMATDRCGLVGATGSWQSYYSTVFQRNRLSWEIARGVKGNISKYKLILKAFFYWRFFFKPFPNPHIRTNSFMISRPLLLEMDTSYITNKFGAYRFESGRKGLSNAIVKMGLKLLVINRSGKRFEPEQWPQSLTFHIAEQEGLLVADNRTREYVESNAAGKMKFSYLAWGKKHEV